MYLEKKMSFEDVRNALVIAYADGFLDDEEFLIITNPLILHFHTGILIHSVWMCSTLASAKLTSG